MPIKIYKSDPTKRCSKEVTAILIEVGNAADRNAAEAEKGRRQMRKVVERMRINRRY
jgi:hypothetical protein